MEQKKEKLKKNSSQVSCGSVIYATGFYFIEVIRKQKSQKMIISKETWFVGLHFMYNRSSVKTTSDQFFQIKFKELQTTPSDV